MAVVSNVPIDYTQFSWYSECSIFKHKGVVYSLQHYVHINKYWLYNTKDTLLRNAEPQEVLDYFDTID